MKNIIIGCFLVISSNCMGQALEEKLVAALDSFAFANPQEKVYIQTDRSRYLAGETIWFKTYNTLFEKPGILSKVVYVTLADETGTVLQKKQLKLVNASAAGEIELPGGLNAGNYVLSAYTLWMRNFPAFITAKKITVYNSTKNQNEIPKKQQVQNQVSIHFFPEGGKIISGLATNIAFKCVDGWKRPLDVQGSIINSKNITVTNFASSHDGMGLINFKTEPGETYSAFVNVNGKVTKFPLPALAQEGITLTADNGNPSKTFVKLERSEKNKDAYNNLLLVAQQNYEVVYMAKINFEEGQDAVAINKKNLVPGMMQITVFAQDGRPLANRTVFVQDNNPEVAVAATLTKNKRGKNTITVDLSSFTSPDIALSVVNAGIDTSFQETNIRSSLLLSSDIDGHVRNPGYYFRRKDSATLQHLDLVMLVHGWSRFEWPEVMASRFQPLKYPFETGLSVSGKVTRADGKSALSSGKINLVIKAEDSTTILSEGAVNANASFAIGELDFKKSANIYYQGTNKNNQNALVSVKINDGHFDTLQHFLPPNYLVTMDHLTQPAPGYFREQLQEKELKDDAKTKLLNEVVLVSKKMSPVDSMTKLYVSPVFEYSDQTLVMDEGHYFDIWQYLQRMVPGIMVDKRESTPRINFSRYDGLDFLSSDRDTSVQLFLNEIPVTADIADDINTSDISLIKVYKGVSGIALGASRGAISIYTKKGVSSKDWRVKGFEFIKKAGYSSNRAFYAIDYSILNPESSFTDVRPTIYWDPYVKVVNGKAVVEFYNDDVTTQHRIILEGIDKNGRLVSLEKILE